MYELLGYIAICSCKYFTYERVHWCLYLSVCIVNYFKYKCIGKDQ